MADDIRTVLKFVGDTKSAEAAITSLVASLQRAAAASAKLFTQTTTASDKAAASINRATTAASSAASSIDAGAKSALAYAQATARLQSAQGNLAGAQKTLSTALGTVSKESIAAVRAQTQLVAIEAQLSTAAGKAETAMLREAQAVARLQQIAGNTPAAIRTLEDALAKISNRSSLPALRAELQKTYLDTNYANSPLIGAIDRINVGLTLARPLIGNAAGSLQTLVGITQAAGQALFTTSQRLDQGKKSATGFADAAAAIGKAISNFSRDQAGTASLSLGLANLLGAVQKADFAEFRNRASSAFATVRGAALSAAEGVARVGLAITGAVAAITTGAGILAVGLFSTIGQRALDAAKEVDAARQSIAALVGGAEAANAKISELRKLAQESPGVTAGLATTLFSQLRASSNIADDAINRVIKSVGKLNAVFTIDDPKAFSRNLIQIFSQGFERADIKEALGRVPIFEQFLEQAFGTKDAGRLRALKDSGKLTLEGFLGGLSDAINNDARFANVRESLGAQFAKAADNITFALAPVGDAIAKILLPLIERIQPAIESAAGAIAREIDASRESIIGLADEIRFLIRDVGLLLEELNKLSGGRLTFDLSQELADLRVLVTALRETVELFVASTVAGFDLIVNSAMRGWQAALNVIGIQIDELDQQILASGARLQEAAARMEQGFEATRRAAEEARAAAELASLPKEQRQLIGLFAGDESLAGTAPTKPKPRPTPASSGKSAVDKGRQRAIREQAQAELKILQLQEREAELSSARITENLRRSLQDRLVSLQAFTELSVRVENELLAKKLEILAKEEGAAVRTAKNKTDREAKLREIALRRAQLEQESALKVEALYDDLRRSDEAAEEAHVKRLVEIREIGRKAVEDSIKRAANTGLIGQTEAEEQILDLERGRFEEREALLRRELEAARENVEERQRIQDELRRLAAERAAFELDASARIQDAMKREAGAFTDFIRSRVAALADLRRAELETGAAKTALDLQRGLITERQAREEDFARRRELIRIESLEREQQIERQAQQLAREAQDARLGAAALLQIEQDKNAALKAERERAAAERQALAEQERAVSLTPGFGENAALAIAGVEAALGRQLTLWEQNRVALGSYTADLQQAAEDAWAKATNVLGVFTDALGAAIDAFVESGGSLKAAGKALVKALASPFIEAAKTRAKFEAAEALASLAAFDFRGALLHGLAAAGFAALAGLGTALTSGGGGASGGGSSSQRSEGGQQINKEQRAINQNTAPRPEPVVVMIRASYAPGVILEQVVNDFRNNGQTREMLRRDLLREG